MRTRGIAASDCFSADQVARAGGAERRARDQPLEVVDGLARLAKLPALGPKRSSSTASRRSRNRSSATSSNIL